MINYLRDSISATFGLPPQGPRLQVSQPIIQNAPVTHNHINVDRSIIGSINTAQVERIEVAMNDIKNNGNNEVSEALKSLTEAVISSNEVQAEIRDQLVEQLAFIAEQAVLPDLHRQKSVIKVILGAISSTISTAASLTTLWLQIQPILSNFFK
jgi:hypothetical protein